MIQWDDKLHTLLEIEREWISKLTAQGGCISVDFFDEWMKVRQRIGEVLADQAISSCTLEHDAYIFSVPVHTASFAHFLRSDVQSKNFHISERTLRNTIASGFIDGKTAGFQSKPLCFDVGNETYYGVIRNNEECLTRSVEVSDIPIRAACYDDGSFIVSDIDLVQIALRTSDTETIYDSCFGELSCSELNIVREINTRFQNLVTTYYHLDRMPPYRLLAHGPGSRFSQSKASHLHFPMKVYTSSGAIEKLGEKDDACNISRYLDYMRGLKKDGYYAPLNPNWGLCEQWNESSLGLSKAVMSIMISKN